MNKVNRRSLLASLGAFGGTAALCGYAGMAATEPNSPVDEPDDPRNLSKLPARDWKYVKLDPAVVAERAYRIYPEGGCMFAVAGSVIGTLADQVGEPYRSFPVEMMRFGDGGVGGWGSLCGVINGSSALIGLFHSEKSKETREALITELCAWYEQTPLPKYAPADPQWADEADPSVAGSILCHISTARWCEASAYEAFSMEKKERCRRLATDGAMKVVELLNRKVDDDACEFAGLAPEVKSCVDCHGKRELADAMGKMSCGTCHQFEGKHPDTTR